MTTIRTLFLLLILPFWAEAQSLRSINHSYLYDPGQPVSLSMIPAREGEEWVVGWRLEVQNASLRAADFSIRWEVREDYDAKAGQPVPNPATVAQQDDRSMSGTVRVNGASNSILVAIVSNSTLNTTWLFHKILNPNLSRPGLVTTQTGSPIVVKFARTGEPLQAPGTWITFYKQAFPPASPPFSEAQARVSKNFQPDSVFRVEGTFQLNEKGLYLIQQDTSSDKGISLRVEEDYPRFAKVQNLVGPFIYICTKQEYDRLEASNGDKKIFDRTVLQITLDTERAKNLIKNYFRQVELANIWFSSYKEGWKTDRGMIFIVFGTPKEVYLSADREIWIYEQDQYDVRNDGSVVRRGTKKITFNFAASKSIFDPENFVLIRDKKFTESWYEMIDLWRSGRK